MAFVPRALRRTFAALALTTALASASFAQANQDTITLKDNKVEQGRIKTEEYAGVTFETKGGSRTIPWSDLAPNGITYSGAEEYQAAKDLLDQGKFDEALAAFEELKADTKLKPLIKQNVLYFIPVIQQRGQKLDEALTGYQELIAAFPKSRYLMDAAEGITWIHLAKKDAAGATKAIDKLSGDALGAGVEAGFSSALNVLKGRVLEDQGKHAEARAAYTVAGTGAGVSPTVVLQAQLGQGRALVALNQKAEAEALFRKVAAADAPNQVRAGAWNGIGDLMLEAAVKAQKPDAEKVLDAAYCYLRGVVLYGPPLPGESTLEHERALKGAADSFNYMQQLESNAERKRFNKARSDQLLEQLRRSYPTSKYLGN